MEKVKPRKSRRMSVRCDCDQDFKDRVMRHAKIQHRTESNFVRHILTLWMDAEEKSS